jgi:hypothetical protein
MALNLIGASLGPLVVAAITEHVFRDETALGNSMSVFCLGVMGIATLMFALGRSAMPATLGPQDKNGAEAA